MSIRLAWIASCMTLLAACSPPSPSTEEEEVPADYAPQPLTAEHLANLIAADGARHTVLVLTGPADPTGIDKVFAGIATGTDGWLAVVPAIGPELDAPQAQALQAALTTALPRNAAGVLALIPDHASPSIVCRPTADPDMTARRAAVDAVADPGLQAARTECLRFLVPA